MMSRQDRIIRKVAKNTPNLMKRRERKKCVKSKVQLNTKFRLWCDAFACFFFIFKLSFEQSKKRGSKFPNVLCKINGFYFHSFVSDFKFANGNGMCARDKEQAKTLLSVRSFICFCTSSISSARSLRVCWAFDDSLINDEHFFPQFSI